MGYHGSLKVPGGLSSFIMICELVLRVTVESVRWSQVSGVHWGIRGSFEAVATPWSTSGVSSGDCPLLV